MYVMKTRPQRGVRKAVYIVILCFFVTLFILFSPFYIILSTQHACLPIDDFELENDFGLTNGGLGNIDIDSRKDTDKTIILFWTDSDWDIITNGMKTDPGCYCADPDNNIVITRNRSLADEATAIAFLPRDMRRNPKNLDMPQTRRRNQIWVLFEYESYIVNRLKYNRNWAPFNGLFNWTIFFRRDSDIPLPYGIFRENEKVIPENSIKMPGGLSLDEWISRKNGTKLMASVISNCKSYSGRVDVIKILKNLSFPLDTYGGCGDLKLCSRFNPKCNLSSVWADVASQYKFFFAAENSVCEDYITEKFWRSLDLGMVPVVLGGADCSQFAPPNSYINIRDFSSGQHLVDFLIDLDKDPKRYKSYFLWRSRYNIWRFKNDCFHGWCKLCEKAAGFRLTPDELKPSNVYNDLEYFFKTISASADGLPERRACLSRKVMEHEIRQWSNSKGSLESQKARQS